jgi:hemolysin activation/secretion protein
VLGVGKVFGSRITVPFESSAEGYHAIMLGADYKDFVENIHVDPETALQTPISYSNLSIGHTSVWRSPNVDFSLNSTANFGLRGAGNSPQEFADKGFKARPNYFYVRSDAVLNTPLFFDDWRLQTRLAGQYALSPIISNEQFAIGGADGVRGYLEAEELADIGAKFTLQVQAPPWRWLEDRFQLGTYAFWDSGLVYAAEPLRDERRTVDLHSVGLGFNLAVFKMVDGSFAWAYPLVPGSRTEKHASRFLFSIRAFW